MIAADDPRVPMLHRSDTPRRVLAERTAYIGVEPCGCVTFARAVDATARGDADSLARVTRSGRVIDRVSRDEADRRLARGCSHRQAAA